MRLKVTLAAVVALALFAFGAGTAGAANIFAYDKTFDGSATDPGAFGGLSPHGMAIDQTTGDVYALDIQHGLVDIFNSEGEYQGKIDGSATPATSLSLGEPSGVAVDNSSGSNAGSVYVADTNHNVIAIFNAAGGYVGQLTGASSPGGNLLSPAGVAVDDTGSVYVSDSGHQRILKYTSASGPVDDGDYVSELTDPNLVNPTSLDLDADENLYVTNFHQTFVKFNAAGVFQETISHSGNFPRSLTVDRSTGNVLYDNYSAVVIANSDGVELTRVSPVSGNSYGVAYDEGLQRLFIGISDAGKVDIFKAVDVPTALTEEATGVFRPDATLNGVVNDDGAGPATCEFEYGTDTNYGSKAPCVPAGPFNDGQDHAVSADITGLSAETTYHFRLVAKNAEGSNFGVDRTFYATAIPMLETDPASSIAAHSVTLNGSLDPAGADTRYYFEYGADTAYGKVVPALPGTLVPGTPEGDRGVSASLTGIEEAHTYHYRIVAVSSFGTSFGEDESFTTPALPPEIVSQSVTDVHSDSAILHARVKPGGAQTKFHFEYGPADCSANPCTSVPIPDGEVPGLFGSADVSRFVGGLSPATTYHYRVVAENEIDQALGPDRTFTTFPQTDVIVDDCANAHVRQQTGAALLLDCRAYELVSAEDTGGYNVETDLVPGQEPFGGYPEADDPPRALYAVNDGAIPGTGSPTNNGPDAYLAARTDDGWKTKYVGVPADQIPGGGPFSSPLLEASADLSTFAFGGAGICDPCFADDDSTNVPVRTADGSLAKGMAGSLDPGPADPAGEVRRRFSEDGAHFVFGSTAKFEPDANSNGDVTIYDRNLTTGKTQVVSKLPDGTTMTGAGIAELDMSDDGTRIVIGKRVSTDASGNGYWHPYLHLGSSPNTIDLAPGASGGVIYNGMNESGTSFFFSTRDPLVGDSDTSIDLYRSDVVGGGAELTRLSTGSGGTGDTDECEPVASTANVDWNSVDAASDCSVAAIAGGGGIAREEGSIFFLSPELLDGPDGVEDAPNLYLARPGEDPEFVTTLESELTGPPPSIGHDYLRSQGLLSNPQSVDVDQSTGEVYVLDRGSATVRKYDSSGEPVDFSASQSYIDGNQLTGTTHGAFGFSSQVGEYQVAVDSSGGPADGNIYVTDTNAPDGNGVIDVFDSTGTFKGRIGPQGFFAGNCGVAVGPSGAVYVAGPTQLTKFTPVDANPDNNVESGTVEFANTCQVAVDSTGAVYVHNWFEDVARKYDASSFSGPDKFTLMATGVTSVAVDPATDDAYITKKQSVQQFDSDGNLLGEFGARRLSKASDAAVDTDGEVYVSDPGAGGLVVFGPSRTEPNPLSENPAVTHAVNDAETHRYGDFQVTPDGDHAAFGSTIPLTGYDTAGHAEVYRWEAATGDLDCASCAPTGVTATGDSGLATEGLSLSEDGTLFFNSTDELTARDLNKKRDVYEWKDGEVALISTGASTDDSSLLGISADGTDAYFFTRERLVAEDRNGSLMRIYDARSGGGFPRLPAAVRCQASDECHGPGTVQPPDPAIGTFKGSLGNEAPLKCKKPKVKRKGKCVKKPKKKKTKKKGKRGGRNR